MTPENRVSRPLRDFFYSLVRHFNSVMLSLYRVDIPSSAMTVAFENTFSAPQQKRGDFFHDVRREFHDQVRKAFQSAGLDALAYDASARVRPSARAKVTEGGVVTKLTGWKHDIEVKIDAQFCRGYGTDDYSLEGINYLDRGYCELPSLKPFLEVEDFSLGSLLVQVPNADYRIDLSLGPGIKLAGYTQEIARSKRSSQVCLLGVRFDQELLAPFRVSAASCNHAQSDLDEVRLGTINFPITYICRRCGQLLTCTCFAGNFSVSDDICRHLPYDNSEQSLRAAAEAIAVRPDVCSLCTSAVPRLAYGHAMYYSIFMQRYLPYQRLLARRRYGHDVYDGPEYRESENETRRAFGFPEIGQRWLTEILLFKMVSAMFAPAEVIQHYRGKELSGLELDIWIPHVRLGIEYQGEQHYEPLMHWGGEAGLQRRRVNDQKKRLLCEQLGYTLVEFAHSEELTEEFVRNRLSSFARNARRDQ